MKYILTSLLASCLGTWPVSAAFAAATDWIEETGARIRLVAAEPAPGDKEIRAALQIELKDGWKTYWRDPGDAGVPPQISITGEGISGFEMHYPAPDRFDDGKSVWAGYKHSVAFPLTLKVAGDAPKVAIKATSFLGICEDICVPVQNEFTLDVPVATASTEDQTLVASFFEKLPGKPSADFGVIGMKRTGENVEVEFTRPPIQHDLELFLAANGYMFSAPKSVATMKAFERYSAKIIFAPKDQSGPVDIFYTLKSHEMAVSGTATLPPAQ